MNEPKDEEGGSHKGPPHLPVSQDPVTSAKVGKRPIRSNSKKSSDDGQPKVPPKSRTRAKSTSDKVAKRVDSESEKIVADLTEEVNKPEVETVEPEVKVVDPEVKVVEPDESENNVERNVLPDNDEEGEGSGERVYEEKDCDCGEQVDCGHAMRSVKFCPCYEAFGKEREAAMLGATEIQCRQCKIWWHCECAGIKGLNNDAIQLVESWNGPCCFVLSPFIAKVLKPVEVSEAELEKPVTLKVLQEELIMFQGKLRLDRLNDASQTLPSTSRSKGQCATTELIIKQQLHAYGPVIRATVKDVVEGHSSHMEKSWAAIAAQAKKSTSLDKEALAEVLEEREAKTIEKTQMKLSATEIEREKRRKNIVIRKVPESKSDNGKERLQHDMDFLDEFCGIDANEIQRCFRAGQRDPKKDRALIVVLETEALAKELTNDGDGLQVESGYWINRDQCPTDAHAGFLARQAGKQRREQRGTSQNNY